MPAGILDSEFMRFLNLLSRIFQPLPTTSRDAEQLLRVCISLLSWDPQIPYLSESKQLRIAQLKLAMAILG